MKHLVVRPEKCTGCRTCELACSFGHYGQFNPKMVNIRVIEYEKESVAVPVVCQQCEDASCMKVCPVGAITRTESGAVEINYNKCIGCRLCRSVCPLGNVGYSSRLARVFKCDLCGGDPECVKLCPGKALSLEDENLDDSRRKLAADKIVAAMAKEG